MRRGHFDKSWLLGESGEFIGVAFGSDYCAEHECGIKDIRSTFDVRKTILEKRLLGLKSVEVPMFGLDIRTINKNAAVFYQQDDMYLIGYTNGNPAYLKSLFASESDVVKSSKTNFIGLWDERSFALISSDEIRMRELWSAFEQLDIVIFTGKGSAFSNGSGLSLCIKSRIPSDMAEDMRASDVDAYKLQEAASATGIAKKLEAAGLRYYALSPQWSNADKNEVRFWLNPMNQHCNNYGLFSVQDLTQWIDGEGPIPIKPVEV